MLADMDRLMKLRSPDWSEAHETGHKQSKVPDLCQGKIEKMQRLFKTGLWSHGGHAEHGLFHWLMQLKLVVLI